MDDIQLGTSISQGLTALVLTSGIVLQPGPQLGPYPAPLWDSVTVQPYPWKSTQHINVLDCCNKRSFQFKRPEQGGAASHGIFLASNTYRIGFWTSLRWNYSDRPSRVFDGLLSKRLRKKLKIKRVKKRSTGFAAATEIASSSVPPAGEATGGLFPWARNVPGQTGNTKEVEQAKP
eukprot:1888671-Amphidinium_carterae.1